MAGTRRKARIMTMQSLYELDCANHDATRTLERLLKESSFPKDASDFARETLKGVLDKKPDLDQTILTYAPNWPVEQLSPIDRNILRIALFEILFNNITPPKAAINEAVELAKSFGSESSPKFVNGVLGSVLAKSTNQRITSHRR